MRKWAKKAVSFIRLPVGVFGFGHGIVKAAQTSLSDGDWAALPKRTIRNYTGIDTDTGSFDQSTAISSALTLVGTVAVLKILSWGAKHI